MSKIDPKKRVEVQNKIDRVLRTLDPTGKNADKYKAMFEKMSDGQFVAFFQKMASDPNNNFYVEVDLFDKKSVTMASIKKAGELMKCPLEEYVEVFHTSGDGSPVRSAYRVPVFYVHLKRMQQILSKKNRMNIDVMKAGARSKLTGSLSDRDKTGRLTDSDTLALLSATNNVKDDYNFEKDARNALLGRDPDNYILKEILGARADNMHHKFQMQTEISILGQSMLSGFEEKNIHAGQALNTLDVFLVGAGLKSDLITDGLMTKQAIQEKAKKK